MLFLLIFAAFLQPIESQEFPLISCPDYFQYVYVENKYIGKITLPNPFVNSLKLVVKFSQREAVQNEYFGKLSVYDDDTLNNIRNGLPIVYRLDFPVLNVLPKITHIDLNGDVKCSGSEYPPPSSNVRLESKLQMSSSSILRPIHNSNNNYDAGSAFENAQRQPEQNTWAPAQAQQQPISGSYGNCGRESGSSFTPFVHGGTVLRRGQFPWLAAIYRKKTDGLHFNCGGSLLSSSTVISAAHCFLSTALTAERVVIYLGRNELDNYSEDGAVIREVSKLIIHPDFNEENFPDADLAIVHMKSPVTFNKYIQPICLWTETTEITSVVGQIGSVAGWGADENKRKISPFPKKVDVNIVVFQYCQQSYNLNARVTLRALCAGNTDSTGPCLGDSGGGLMIQRNGQWVLRGIVSAGRRVKFEQQCDLSHNVLYCDVAEHNSWIKSNMLS